MLLFDFVQFEIYNIQSNQSVFVISDESIHLAPAKKLIVRAKIPLAIVLFCFSGEAASGGGLGSDSNGANIAETPSRVWFVVFQAS